MSTVNGMRALLKALDDAGVVISATANTPTLSKQGGRFDLSGAPLDGNQVLIATFAAFETKGL